MTYDIQYFIDKFEAIPEDKWAMGGLGHNGIHCVLGHCGVTPNGDDYDGTDESKALCLIFGGAEDDYPGVYRINDSGVGSPKVNMLEALYSKLGVNL